MARRARGFDMDVLYTDIARRDDMEAKLSLRYVDQDTLLRESDFVSLHTVLLIGRLSHIAARIA